MMTPPSRVQYPPTKFGIFARKDTGKSSIIPNRGAYSGMMPEKGILSLRVGVGFFPKK
ncbi:MAG: hypothetical protein ACE5DM_00600 [Candidatus Nanoarchaeia archaeon]